MIPNFRTPRPHPQKGKYLPVFADPNLGNKLASCIERRRRRHGIETLAVKDRDDDFPDEGNAKRALSSKCSPLSTVFRDQRGVLHVYCVSGTAFPAGAPPEFGRVDEDS